METRTLGEISKVRQGLATVGRGAGARQGDWKLRLVEGHDLGESSWPDLENLREISIVHRRSTEKHLLRPHDVLVSARSEHVKAAIVPPGVSRTAASVTLLVVQPSEPRAERAAYIWYFLTSAQGQAQLKSLLAVSRNLHSLSARNLGRVELPVPEGGKLAGLARLAEASEEAHAASMTAARLRRETLRDAVIREVMERDSGRDPGERRERMGNSQAAIAMERTALALAAQADKTGMTALEILDVACEPYRGCDADFDERQYADHAFGQLLGKAFLEGDYDPEADEDGEWWYENVIRRFSQRYGFW